MKVGDTVLFQDQKFKVSKAYIMDTIPVVDLVQIKATIPPLMFTAIPDIQCLPDNSSWFGGLLGKLGMRKK